jgi:hypothetical protein
MTSASRYFVSRSFARRQLKAKRKRLARNKAQRVTVPSEAIAKNHYLQVRIQKNGGVNNIMPTSHFAPF